MTIFRPVIQVLVREIKTNTSGMVLGFHYYHGKLIDWKNSHTGRECLQVGRTVASFGVVEPPTVAWA